MSLKTPIKLISVGVEEKLKNAINESIKDFKATLFIENLELEDINSEFKVNKIELNLETE